MERVRLSSGREVLIRPIRISDGPGLRAAYERLSPESKYRRFLAPKPYLSASDARYLVELDWTNHYALVAARVDRPDWIMAVGRFVRLADDPGAAELAIVVGDPFRREGLATEIIDRLIEAATERGITRFAATSLAENEPARRLIRSIRPGGVRSQRRGTLEEFDVDLAA
jgi:RimJ/RimL family protein N-acetyltransferase